MTALPQAVIPQAIPDQWRDALAFVLSGITWILDWQRYVFGLVMSGPNAAVVAKGVLLLLPTALLVAALWCTIVSVYTLPFRSGRGAFLGALLMAWWDAGRMTWFFWAGLLRFAVVLLGWVWSLLKLAGALFVRLIRFLVTRPFALLDWATSQYFQPGVPWLAFLLILLWSALEATIFTFTLRPTLSEVLADLTGVELAGWAVTSVLWPFLFFLIAGSFAAIQTLSEAVQTKKASQIIGMVIVEACVMFFEVMFLYRELVDAITPWIAEQTGFQLGFVSTLVLASFGWIGVRAMTWFLFGRFGTPALMGVISRKEISGAKGGGVKTTELGPEFWRGPISALKAETAWFKSEARSVFELISLPVLQMLAAAVNFAVVVILGRPTFTLPFRSLDQVLAGTPLFGAPAAAPTKVPASGGVA